MTTLETILAITIYLIVGLWICFKRNYYESNVDSQIEGFCLCLSACVFMPINLFIVLFKEFILKKWDNY